MSHGKQSDFVGSHRIDQSVWEFDEHLFSEASLDIRCGIRKKRYAFDCTRYFINEHPAQPRALKVVKIGCLGNFDLGIFMNREE